MRKHFNLIITVMILCSILLLLLIVGPEVRGSIVAADSNSETVAPVQESGEGTSDTEKNGSGGESGGTTEGAVKEEKDQLDVNCEIVEPKVSFDLKYQQYPLTYLYLLVQNQSVHIRKGPSTTEPAIMTAAKNEKLNYIETVKNNGETWYHVCWYEKDQNKFGFVNAGVVTKRVFQFDKMYEAIKIAEEEAKGSTLTCISNYHNNRGNAPLYHGQSADPYGGTRGQSAPGYLNPLDLTEFAYLGDGTLLKVLGSGDNMTKVSLVGNDKIYYVPNKYISSPAAIVEIKKAIVIDRANQNEVTFEKTGKEWKVISYTLATTGTTGQYHQPTPLGYYYAIEKRERFYYYKDGTTKIQGYAPYVIRFAGGAYIHGVPVNYKFTAEGVRVDPGKIEYSRTMGTVPLSHKCVRNYTSHAKFLYDWYVPGETIVIVIE